MVMQRKKYDREKLSNPAKNWLFVYFIFFGKKKLYRLATESKIND